MISVCYDEAGESVSTNMNSVETLLESNKSSWISLTEMNIQEPLQIKVIIPALYQSCFVCQHDKIKGHIFFGKE